MLPAPGLINGFEYTFPQGIRFDHCIYDGLEVKSDFDPMIGKLVAYGHNRSVVIRKMRSALSGLAIEGIKNNVSLHRVIVDEENFKSGRYTTNYISEVAPQERVEELKKTEELYKKAISMEMGAIQERRGL